MCIDYKNPSHLIELEKIRFTSMLIAKCINQDIGKYKFNIVKDLENKLFIAREFTAPGERARETA